MLIRAVCMLIGYLFGCILTAEIVSKHYTGKSTSEIGTGNPGMANVMGNIGKVPGAIVLVGDILKTGLPMIICNLLFAKEIGSVCMQYAGLGVLLGHNFPFWKKFKGGKGVTVTCTWLIVGYLGWGIVCDLVGAAVVFITGWLPLAAVVISILAIPMSLFVGGVEDCVILTIACVIMFTRHWHGLQRIRKGEEKTHLKLVGKKKEKQEKNQ